MRAATVIVIASGLASCGGGSGTPEPDADPGAPARCENRDRYAHFYATSEPGGTSRYGSQVGGWVADGRAPEFVEPVDSEGACRYVAPSPALCTPACTDGEICDVHGDCVAFPTNLAVGTVRLTGTTPPVTLTPQLGNAYYSQVPYPGLYAPGATLVLDVEGGSGIEPIHLETTGLPPVQMPADTLTATEHQDFVVTWTAVAGHPGAEVIVELHNDHHAGPEYIECTADASLGAVTVPAAILDQLIEAGEIGIGTYIESASIELRKRASVTSSRGCVAFDSSSDEFFFVDTVRVP